MRGEVEIWKGEDLILKEPNMLVDGAGELLADIMTVSRSLSGVEDHATSSILDASNYRVNAISFGTGPEAFTKNGHDYNIDGATVYVLSYITNVKNGTTGNVTLMPVEDTTGKIPSDPGLPEAPTPEKTLLQEGCDVPGDWTGLAVGKLDFSAIFPANGQLQNFIPSAIVSGYIEQNYPAIAGDGNVENLWPAAGSILGCFPDGSSAPHTTANRLVFYERPYGGPTSIKRVSLGGFFNEVSSMDSGGFVNMVMSSVPNPGLDFSGGASGLCLSAEAPANDYEGFPFVEYTVSLSKDDCIFANAYGGITDLGLWSIDMKKSLQAGNSPPFEFAVVNNPRKYKLFCRKGFSTNIVASTATNLADYKDLTLKWRIYFR